VSRLFGFMVPLIISFFTFFGITPQFILGLFIFISVWVFFGFITWVVDVPLVCDMPSLPTTERSITPADSASPYISRESTGGDIPVDSPRYYVAGAALALVVVLGLVV
jgi:hypothetical protein